MYDNSYKSTTKPIFLFADSQLLFWNQNGKPFLNTIRDFLTQIRPKAAYIGASNGDEPTFYSIFEAAMDSIDIRDRRRQGMCDRNAQLLEACGFYGCALRIHGDSKGRERNHGRRRTRLAQPALGTAPRHQVQFGPLRDPTRGSGDVHTRGPRPDRGAGSSLHGERPLDP